MSSSLNIVAEAGSVHDGSLGNALKLIELAAACGANTIKFQTHIAEAETVANAPNPPYFSGEPRFDYFERTAFTMGQWQDLKLHAKKHGISFLSSPFSIEAVDFLEELGLESYKIPSGEVSNIPLLEKIAKTGKPVFLSSGMSNWEELDDAVSALKSCPLTIMQCSSIYPCPPENVGINVITEMQARYGIPTGFSDHTTGFAAAILAVGEGATAIEKHLTFSKNMYGSDALHSMEPEEFTLFCFALREAHMITQNPVDKTDIQKYKDMKRIFEKSIVTKTNVQKGMIIDTNNITFKKPGSGMPARNYKNILGKTFSRDLPQDSIITEEDVINA